MKKILIVLLVVAVALVAASSAMATIAGSKHDLTSSGTGSVKSNTTGSLAISSCQFCHTPHRAAVVAGAPLWNRDLSTIPNYITYGSNTTAGTGITLFGTTVNQPGPNSKTCLSCHDGNQVMGTVIVGSAQNIPDVANRVTGGKLTTNNVNNIANYTGETNNLNNDHPIGMNVASSSTAAGLDTRTNMSNKGYTFYGASFTMECATCHDPHVSTSSYFLRGSAGLAGICSDCHINK